MLIETIEQVRDGTLDAKQATTIAKLSTTVLQSARLDLEYLRFKSMHDAAADNGAHTLRLTSEATPAKEAV